MARQELFFESKKILLDALQLIPCGPKDIFHLKTLAHAFAKPSLGDPEDLAYKFTDIINTFGTAQHSNPKYSLPPLISAFKRTTGTECSTLAEIHEECLRRAYGILDESKKMRTLQAIGQQLLVDPTALAQLVGSSTDYLELGIADHISSSSSNWLAIPPMRNYALRPFDGQQDHFPNKPSEIENGLSQHLLIFRFLRDFAPPAYDNYALFPLVDALFTKRFFLTDQPDKKKFQLLPDELYRQYPGIPRLFLLVDSKTAKEVYKTVDPYLDDKPLPPTPEDINILARLEP